MTDTAHDGGVLAARPTRALWERLWLQFTRRFAYV